LRNERQDDVITWLHGGDTLADGFHDARTLVTEHRRQRREQRAVHDRQVGVAHARGAHLHLDLAGLGRVEIDVDDFER
jgi:hypothetical protein